LINGIMPPATKKASKRLLPLDISDRPPPVPPPPMALISLLKSNKDVLKYFSSLQANVDADVLKYKAQAKRYKQECVELQAELDKATKNVSKQPSAKKEASRRVTAPKAAPPPATRVQDVPKPLAAKEPSQKENEINDCIFNDMLNELSSEEEDSVQVETPDKKERSISFSLLLSSDEDENENDDTSTGIQPNSVEPDVPSAMIVCLRQARDNLRKLGIALTESKTAMKGSTSPDTTIESEKIDVEHDESQSVRLLIVRRSNQDIASEIFFALHSVTKFQNDYQPFSLQHFVPCHAIDTHPAYQAKECVFDALVMMDAYCSFLQDDDWELIFVEGDEELSVGMKNRKGLVVNMMESLHGEVVDLWPRTDRSTRVITKAVHFDQENEIKQTVEHKCNERFGSRNKGRIALLAERCIMAELLVRLYLHRGESHEAASLVVQYINSSASSLAQNEYPRYPPVLSICIIESMICCGTDYFFPVFKSSPQLLNALSLIIRTVATIWKERLESVDDRITDIAKVEVSSYHRFIKSESCWSGNNELTSLVECRSELDQQIDQLEETFIGDRISRESILLTDQLLMILKGDLDFMCQRMDNGIKSMSEELSVTKKVHMTDLSVFELAIEVGACTCRQLLIRSLDRYRQEQGTILPINESMNAMEMLRNLMGLTIGYCSRSEYSPQIFWFLVRCTLQACANLADGDSAHRIISFSMSLSNSNEYMPFQTLLSVGEMPTVRIINLERRADRWNTSISQALIERLLVVRAVAKLDSDEMWGQHAYDGVGRTFAANQNLAKIIGRPLNELVEEKWKPTDLLAFDYEARKDEALIPMSPSERACALSHLCSWKGVERSLNINIPASDGYLTPQLLQLYRISGFARGPPLLYTHEAMPPVPVCVILEDDAILVDRFVDRLEDLLAELPRDFHFCSIGYSRPRTAPMVELSSQLGIPTCLWYLTGYILSLDGASHLLKSLPIVGPVDSWIGLQMMSNWDNIYGEQVGVGVHAQQNTSTPSRKELAKICKFRAFAALVPLCNQKTHLQKVEGVSGRNWRQRDTDITFSGR